MKKIIFIVIILFCGWTFWPGLGQSWSEIFITEGQNAHDVAKQLVDSGLIQSKVSFLLWIKLRHVDSRIQVGKYRFSNGRSAFWIVDDLLQGRFEKAKIVIPEGFSSWQIAERLEAQKICDGEKFKDYVQAENLEGYLFPATYDLTYGLSAASVAKTMTAQFDLRWTAEMDNRAKEMGFSKSNIVVLASIVQREVRMRDEMPLVAAVYHNRLRKKMRLEADPTVQYALGYWKNRLTYDDYRKTKSPYNTYLHAGLPLGPICNPGWDAIRATLWPAGSNALFFLARGDGYHTFSETYREHSNKVNKRNRALR